MELIDNTWAALTLLATLGSGLIGGVFFAFSSFVMPALDRLPPPQAIAAMQAINIVVVRSLFLVVFLGTAGICVLLIAHVLIAWAPQTIWQLAGSGLYLIGTFAVTGVRNVPLNNELAAGIPSAPGSADLWGRYVSEWTFWNHVRTLAALAASILLVVAFTTGSC